jgi:hypothetical protein
MHSHEAHTLFAAHTAGSNHRPHRCHHSGRAWSRALTAHAADSARARCDAGGRQSAARLRRALGNRGAPLPGDCTARRLTRPRATTLPPAAAALPQHPVKSAACRQKRRVRVTDIAPNRGLSPPDRCSGRRRG